MAVVLFSLRAKDNLCIKDKEAAPKVSFIHAEAPLYKKNKQKKIKQFR